MKIRKIMFVVFLSVILSVVLLNNIECSAAQKKINYNEAKSFDKMFKALETPLATYILETRPAVGSRSGKVEKMDFKKSKYRRIILDYRAYYETQYSSVDFFGKKTSNGNNFIYGDMGDYWPVFKNKDVYKVGKNKYRIDFDACFEDCTTDRIDNLARVSAYVTKYSKSVLGYKMTKLVIKYK